ncbi:UNVERIFIED_CONTAM: hypothetical protein Slati_2269700, partial [Sesamum latifolium]
ALKNNRINGTLTIGSSHSNQLQLIDLQNNSIEGFTLQADYSVQIIVSVAFLSSLIHRTRRQLKTARLFPALQIEFPAQAEMCISLHGDTLFPGSFLFQPIQMTHVSEHQFERSAISDIAKLAELQTLDLSYNEGMTGPLPPAIGNLAKLTSLSLNSNKFIGSIPPSIGNLSNLYWLDLADNKLSGMIPVSDGSTPGLDMLVRNLDQNNEQRQDEFSNASLLNDVYSLRRRNLQDGTCFTTLTCLQPSRELSAIVPLHRQLIDFLPVILAKEELAVISDLEAGSSTTEWYSRSDLKNLCDGGCTLRYKRNYGDGNKLTCSAPEASTVLTLKPSPLMNSLRFIPRGLLFAKFGSNVTAFLDLAFVDYFGRLPDRSKETLTIMKQLNHLFPNKVTIQIPQDYFGRLPDRSKETLTIMKQLNHLFPNKVTIQIPQGGGLPLDELAKEELEMENKMCLTEIVCFQNLCVTAAAHCPIREILEMENKVCKT